MVNLPDIKFDSHDLPVLAANVPGLPLSLQTDSIYPISMTFCDVYGDSHDLDIDIDFNIRIDGDSNFIKELYVLLYGITTNKGKEAAYKYESDYFGPISYDSSVRISSTDKVDELKGMFAFPYEPTTVQLHPLPHLNIIRYYSLSQNGSAVAYKDYALHSKGLKWQSRGVFRLPINKILASDQVLIVDNPIIADFLHNEGICAIPLPSEHETDFFNYPQLFEETKVLFCLKEYGQNYNFSLYPLASQLIEHEVPTLKVNTTTYWLTNQSQIG